jgi:hypothetical protein
VYEIPARRNDAPCRMCEYGTCLVHDKGEVASPSAALWRVGRKVKLNVYEGDRSVCQCHSEEDAEAIVARMNAAYSGSHSAHPKVTDIDRAAARIMSLYEDRQVQGYDAPSFKEVVDLIRAAHSGSQPTTCECFKQDPLGQITNCSNPTTLICTVHGSVYPQPTALGFTKGKCDNCGLDMNEMVELRERLKQSDEQIVYLRKQLDSGSQPTAHRTWKEVKTESELREQIVSLTQERDQQKDKLAQLMRGLRKNNTDFELAFLEAYLDHFRTLRKRAESAEARLSQMEEALRKIEDYDSSCECDDHTNPDCCSKVSVTDCFCAHCIAGEVIAKSERTHD